MNAGLHEKVTGDFWRLPLAYSLDELHTPPSKKGYFLLVMSIGEHRFVEWIWSKN